MNLKNTNNNLQEILNGLSSSNISDLPFGGIKFSVHTIPLNKNNGKYSKSKLKPNIKPKVKIIKEKPNDIILNITFQLHDIYNGKNKKVKIARMRKVKENGCNKYVKIVSEFVIPLMGREVLIEGGGNQLKNYQKSGDILINIIDKEDTIFKRINNYDLLIKKDINIIDLYNKNKYQIKLFSDKIINVQFFNKKIFNNGNFFHKIKELGFPYFIDDVKKRGDLFIKLNLILPDNINTLYNNIKIFIDKTEKEENHEEMNIEDNWHTAYECKLNEIFK